MVFDPAQHKEKSDIDEAIISYIRGYLEDSASIADEGDIFLQDFLKPLLTRALEKEDKVSSICSSFEKLFEVRTKTQAELEGTGPRKLRQLDAPIHMKQQQAISATLKLTPLLLI
ncbi:ATP-binding cassette, regulator of translational elongation [Entomophthora muscae]|uniref:ATP-binding cassette, regulator of translational elongation n=1 Tax=Entomophthora muscae TaxID=34485 RepID=A0ACC2SX54_9FUNG|nr:ATP-binding cassette, regulator of translational elongation [Entomophthora muscae]